MRSGAKCMIRKLGVISDVSHQEYFSKILYQTLTSIMHNIPKSNIQNFALIIDKV